MKYSIFISVVFLLSSCYITKSAHKYKSDTLIIKKLTEHTYVHTSYLDTDDFGKVACNGMIVIDQGEAVIIDSPTDGPAAIELINWIESKQNSRVVAVVATHFHMDCLGGLEEFHNRSIISYAHYKTTELAREHNRVVPYVGFEDQMEISVGQSFIINQYAGEGHTVDNIVSYFPSDQVLFGGCLIKSQGASKGNLEDANTAQWSQTVRNVKAKFPSVKKVIPGHGDSGGVELLDYTIELFEQDK
jgi:metallo-beta-lactamase class B